METTVQLFSTQCSAGRGKEGRVVQFHLWEASPRGDPSKTDADVGGASWGLGKGQSTCFTRLEVTFLQR